MTAELDVGFGAQLLASLDGLAVKVGGLCDRMDREQLARKRANEAIRPWWQAGQITLTAGAGTLQDFNRFGCPLGYKLSIRRITAYGFTAGTVIAYTDSVNGEPVMPFPSAAVNTAGKGELLLNAMSQLVWSATGITGTVNVWAAGDLMEEWLWPWYIGAQRD